MNRSQTTMHGAPCSRLLLLLAVLLTATGSQLQAQKHRSDALDDLLQHLPMATVFALRAADEWADEAGWDHLDSRSSWLQLSATAAASYIMATAATYSLKQLVAERRPDGSDRRSFPSGHATFAFAGATVLAHEYGHLSPWVTVGGYGLAALTAADRVRLDRHYVHDVCAGAAIGIAAAELTYYVRRRLLRSSPVDVAFTPQGFALRVAL